MPTIRVKIAFLVDCTASMEPWIQAAKDQVMMIVRSTQEQYTEAMFETAFVGYRDYEDAERILRISFADPEDMLRRIRNVHADGGGDCAEDVATGLREVWDLDWNDADVKTIIHIADAPAHGRRFHSVGITDRFPDGDPNRLDPLEFLRWIGGRGIDYTFVKINDSTDKMLDVFEQHYGRIEGFKVLDLRPQGYAVRLTTDEPPLTPPLRSNPSDTTLLLSPSIVRTITQSIGRHTASQDPTEV